VADGGRVDERGELLRVLHQKTVVQRLVLVVQLLRSGVGGGRGEAAGVSRLSGAGMEEAAWVGFVADPKPHTRECSCAAPALGRGWDAAPASGGSGERGPARHAASA
jgi:hypothetical protein